MARKKKTQRKVGGHTAEDMLRALLLHRQGSSIRKAARDCNLLYATLNRYIKKYAPITTEELKNQRLTPHYNVNMIFTTEQEAELTAYVKECGQTKVLTTKDVRRAAYELAAVNNIDTPKSWEREKMAGVDWMRSFRDRNFGAKETEVPAVSAASEEVEVTDVNDDSLEALKTLEEGSVDKEKAKADDDVNIRPENENTGVLTDKQETSSVTLVTKEPDIVEIVDDVNNELEENLHSSLRQAVTEALFRDSVNVKIEEPQPFEESCSQDPLSDQEDADDSGSVWSYYEQLSGRRARCVVCRATVARAELRGHLKVHHPKLVAEVDLGSEEEVSDSQEDVYTEVVYLEEEQNAKKAKSLQRKKAKPTPIERPEPRKRQASSSSDEIPLKQKKTENNDEVEQFGKYVTCLLRKIPAAECMELQAEIINLIMKKQLELKRKTSLSPVKTGADKMAGSKANNGISEFLNIPSTSNTLGFNNGYSNLTENKE